MIYDTLREFIESGQLQRCLEQTISHPIGNGAEIIADYVREHV